MLFKCKLQFIAQRLIALMILILFVFEIVDSSTPFVRTDGARIVHYGLIEKRIPTPSLASELNQSFPSDFFKIRYLPKPDKERRPKKDWNYVINFAVLDVFTPIMPAESFIRILPNPEWQALEIFLASPQRPPRFV